MSKTWNTFGPDPPLASLPPDFQACVSAAAPTAECDTIVGSAESGGGYCASPAYQQTTYCACVNNAMPCPIHVSAACANAAHAYQSSKMVASLPECEKTPVCINVVEVGGSQNVVSGIVQQCGTIEKMGNLISTSPLFAAIVFILVVSFLVVLISGASPEPDSAVFWQGLGVAPPLQ